MNIGGAGSYVYDAPVNEAPAAVSMETEAKAEKEERKAPVRGPVKGEEEKLTEHQLFSISILRHLYFFFPSFSSCKFFFFLRRTQHLPKVQQDGVFW